MPSPTGMFFDVGMSGDKKVKGPLWNCSCGVVFDSLVASTLGNQFVSFFFVAILNVFMLLMLVGTNTENYAPTRQPPSALWSILTSFSSLFCFFCGGSFKVLIHSPTLRCLLNIKLQAKFVTS